MLRLLLRLRCRHLRWVVLPTIYIHSEFGVEKVQPLRCVRCGKMKRIRWHFDD